jgi:hypothetical protein
MSDENLIEINYVSQTLPIPKKDDSSRKTRIRNTKANISTVRKLFYSSLETLNSFSLFLKWQNITL